MDCAGFQEKRKAIAAQMEQDCSSSYSGVAAQRSVRPSWFNPTAAVPWRACGEPACN